MKSQHGDKITFIEDLPKGSFESILDQYQPESNKMIILDDLAEAGNNDKRVCKLFSRSCHHKSCSVAYISQNLYGKGSQSRNISLNAQYIFLFKSVRNRDQIACLGRQIFPRNAYALVESYIEATRRPYGYLRLDLRSNTDERYRLMTNVLESDDGEPAVFVPKRI